MTDSNSKYNGSGNGHDPDEDREDNIVRMPTLAERDRLRRQQEKQWRKEYRAANPSEPMINLPPVTKALIAVIVVIHLAVMFALDPPDRFWVYDMLGFTPGTYTGKADVPLWSLLLSPVTYMFIHGSWLHIGMNGVMLMAFGTGAERWMGGKRMFTLFFLCGLVAALVQFILSPFSLNPMVGASGGLSGLFAAVLVMLQSQGRLGGGRYGIWPFAALWIGISFIFGLLGGPDGSAIAWAAHIGGFLAGLALIKPVWRIQ